MSIDIDEVALVMLQEGFDGETFDGWTNTLVDTLENKYGLETKVAEAIERLRKQL